MRGRGPRALRSRRRSICSDPAYAGSVGRSVPARRRAGRAARARHRGPAVRCPHCRGAGPGTAWLRLRVPVVDDETPSPLMRVLAAADFGNGISMAVGFDRYLFINTDLTVYLHCLPTGEWICLDTATTLQRSGTGLAESALYDVHGP